MVLLRLINLLLTWNVWFGWTYETIEAIDVNIHLLLLDWTIIFQFSWTESWEKCCQMLLTKTHPRLLGAEERRVHGARAVGATGASPAPPPQTEPRRRLRRQTRSLQSGSAANTTAMCEWFSFKGKVGRERCVSALLLKGIREWRVSDLLL